MPLSKQCEKKRTHEGCTHECILVSEHPGKCKCACEVDSVGREVCAKTAVIENFTHGCTLDLGHGGLCECQCGLPWSPGEKTEETYEQKMKRFEGQKVTVKINGTEFITKIMDERQFLPKNKVLSFIFPDRLGYDDMMSMERKGLFDAEDVRMIYQNVGYDLCGYSEIFPSDVIENPIRSDPGPPPCSGKKPKTYDGIEGFIAELGTTVRECIDCGCLTPGGPTRCKRCAKEWEETPQAKKLYREHRCKVGFHRAARANGEVVCVYCNLPWHVCRPDSIR